jgi:hypothetical protein
MPKKGDDLRKGLFIGAIVLSLLAPVGCWKSPADQATEHYETMRPIIEAATKALDDLYSLDEQLGNETITLEQAHNKVLELKNTFLAEKAKLADIKVPQDFEDEFQLANNWMDEGEKAFDLMIVSIDTENASSADFQRALDNLYTGWDKETKLYDQMDEAYRKQMAEKGVNLY